MTTAPPARRSRSQPKTATAKPKKPSQTQPAAAANHSDSSAAPPSPASLFDLTQQPGYYNATAKMALLRRGKRAPHDEFLVDFSREQVRMEFRAAGELLLAGDWQWQATVAGEPLKPKGEWSEVSWHRDNSCDYLEIEQPLTNGYSLERQIFFSRNDLIFFLSDCLIGPAKSSAGEIRYVQTLPLASDSAFTPAAETREGWLTGNGRRRASVIPVAQTEWRSDFCHASLSVNDNQLTIEQAAHGRNIISPLWIDLNPSRLKRPLTWRRLTVGEHLTGLPRDVATGYRIQAGNEQWLVYRSLDPVSNRSVMGHNTYGSFVCGRVLPDGNVREILTME
jgi:hypothetical protein